MAQIRPFRAYRPCQGMEKRIAALPYDVYNREEACEVVKKNPDSFLAVDRAETQFGEEVDTYADCVYEKADQLLREKELVCPVGKRVRKQEPPCLCLFQEAVSRCFVPQRLKTQGGKQRIGMQQNPRRLQDIPPIVRPDVERPIKMEFIKVIRSHLSHPQASFAGFRSFPFRPPPE